MDFLVTLDEDRSILDHAALMADLRELLGRRVDVVSEKGLYWLLKKRVAVGTPVTRRPPHRSVRAELPHTAPTSGGWRGTASKDKDAGSGHGEASDRQKGRNGSSRDDGGRSGGAEACTRTE